MTYRDTIPITTRVTAEHNLGTLTQYRTETPDSVKALDVYITWTPRRQSRYITALGY